MDDDTGVREQKAVKLIEKTLEMGFQDALNKTEKLVSIVLPEDIEDTSRKMMNKMTKQTLNDIKENLNTIYTSILDKYGVLDHLRNIDEAETEQPLLDKSQPRILAPIKVHPKLQIKRNVFAEKSSSMKKKRELLDHIQQQILDLEEQVSSKHRKIEDIKSMNKTHIHEIQQISKSLTS